MGKVFEDYFSEIQADMIDICLENVEDRADNVYIYCSYEDDVLSTGYFYKINGKVVMRGKLNEAIKPGDALYDVSADRQFAVLDVLEEDMEKLISLCAQYKREMPTEIKITYNVKNRSLNAEYKYEKVYSESETKTADDIEREWFEEIASEKVV